MSISHRNLPVILLREGTPAWYSGLVRESPTSARNWGRLLRHVVSLGLSWAIVPGFTPSVHGLAHRLAHRLGHWLAHGLGHRLGHRLGHWLAHGLADGLAHPTCG
ncbi:hypothetical protein JZ785_18950 [Alicyclobacillus curvatus]|nr:hypothetical protein JZ785_18950 [Alicyclobacillus curvatus]